MHNELALSDQIRIEKIGSELVIYHLDGNIYIANETAGLIIKTITSGNTVPDIVDMLMGKYDVSASMAQLDVNQCITALLRAGIIHPLSITAQ